MSGDKESHLNHLLHIYAARGVPVIELEGPAQLVPVAQVTTSVPRHRDISSCTTIAATLEWRRWCYGWPAGTPQSPANHCYPEERERDNQRQFHLVKGRENYPGNGGSVLRHLRQQRLHHRLNLRHRIFVFAFNVIYLYLLKDLFYLLPGQLSLRTVPEELHEAGPDILLAEVCVPPGAGAGAGAGAGLAFKCQKKKT